VAGGEFSPREFATLVDLLVRWLEREGALEVEHFDRGSGLVRVELARLAG
jgi:hypothetical protein